MILGGHEVVKKSLYILFLVMLIGYGITANTSTKQPSNSTAVKQASTTKELTPEEKKKNAAHMVAVTTNICSRYDDIIKKYCENIDNIQYNRLPSGSIYNNFEHTRGVSLGIVQDIQDVEIIDQKYVEDKKALIYIGEMIQGASRDMLSFLDNQKGSTANEAENKIANAMQLKKLVQEQVKKQASEDGYTP